MSETLTATIKNASSGGYAFKSAPIHSGGPFVTPLRPFNEILADDKPEADKK